MTHIALRFCLSHPAVTTVIPGVRRVEQVQCNLAALECEPLSQDMLQRLTEVWQQEMSEHVRTSIGEEGEGYVGERHRD
jgi:aryl-alcohol dehydrogenase-like predicted oxidoreductase